MTWRPLPDNESPGAPVQRSLEQLVKRLGMPSTDAVNAAFRLWPEVVGARIAEHSKPISLRDGVLRVVVDDSQWLTQLKWISPKLVQKINEAANSQVVEKVEFRLE